MYWINEGNEQADAKSMRHMGSVPVANVERFRNGFDAASGLAQAALLGELNWVNGQRHIRAACDCRLWGPGIADTRSA
jgi:hypothetical protein